MENIKKQFNETTSDEHIKEVMLTAKSVLEWNELRETVKPFRDSTWISINLDGRGLIKQCNFTIGEKGL